MTVGVSAAWLVVHDRRMKNNNKLDFGFMGCPVMAAKNNEAISHPWLEIASLSSQ
jgi:hypothetical protein